MVWNFRESHNRDQATTYENGFSTALAIQKFSSQWEYGQMSFGTRLQATSPPSVQLGKDLGLIYLQMTLVDEGDR